MANYKSMTVIGSIIELWRRGWTKSRIAQELGIHRETVARYIRLHSEPAGNPTTEGSKPSIPPTGSSRGRRSQCEPFHGEIEARLDLGLSAQRIYQDLVCETGFAGSYDAVKRYVRKLKAVGPKRVYRVECLPGEEAQVDFGTGYYLENANGKTCKAHLLRVVLSHSRKGYTEALASQSTEDFIRGLENAFRYFGGVPGTLRIDNLRAAVKMPDRYDPELVPKVESFSLHYRFVILPCRVRMPQHKGKVENSIKYVKDNALKGRRFSTIAALNKHLRDWEVHVADTRIHGTTRQQVGKCFAEIEQPMLQPLPMALFPCYQEGPRMVHRDSYVEVDKAYYEAPAEYIGQRVWVRWDSRVVRILNSRFEQVAVLPRQAPGKFTQPRSARGGSPWGAEHDVAYWLSRAARMGDHCNAWAMEVFARHGATGIRTIQGLIQMTRKHPSRQINQACERALSHGAYRLRDLRRLIARPETQQNLDFMDNHELIRDMREYSAFLELLEPEPMQETLV
jgi:transposase